MWSGSILLVPAPLPLIPLCSTAVLMEWEWLWLRASSHFVFSVCSVFWGEFRDYVTRCELSVDLCLLYFRRRGTVYFDFIDFIDFMYFLSEFQNLRVSQFESPNSCILAHCHYLHFLQFVISKYPLTFCFSLHLIFREFIGTKQCD